MSSSLLPQQCPVSLAHLTWMICEMGSWWSYSCCLVEPSSFGIFKTASSTLVYLTFFVRIQGLQIYSSTDIMRIFRSCSPVRQHLSPWFKRLVCMLYNHNDLYHKRNTNTYTNTGGLFRFGYEQVY